MMKKLLFLFVMLAFGLTSISQTNLFLGGTDNNWHEASNWSYGTVPVGGDAVTIPAIRKPIISAGADGFANSIDLQGEIEVMGTLSVAGDIAIDGKLTIGSNAEVATSTATNNNGVDGILIQSDATGTGSFIHGSGAPEATVERYIPMGGWHFVSPSTTGVTPENFYIDENNSSWLTSWDETVGDWSYITDPDGPILPLGTGYSYWWEDSPAREMTVPGTVEFKGDLLDPTVPLTVTLTHNGTTDDGAGFNLVGNPWTAAIPINPDLVNELTNCEQSIWIWNNDNSWFEWAAVNDPASGSNLNPLEMTSTHIASGQGVYLRALTGGGSVFFNPINRDPAPGTTFWKDSELTSDEDVNPLIQLLLTNNERTDRSYIMFGENGSASFENGFDVSKMFGSEENSYVFLNEEDHNYTQNYLSPLEAAEERVVDVYVRAGSEGEHGFTVNMDYLPNTLVVLEDTETGTLTEMNNDVVYTFSAKPGDAENRFKLHFTSGVTGIENPGVQEDAVNIYASSKAVYISNKDNSTYETAKVSIFDMYGREIYSTQSRLENNTRIPVNVSNSYLIVRVTKGNNTYTEKVFVK